MQAWDLDQAAHQLLILISTFLMAVGGRWPAMHADALALNSRSSSALATSLGRDLQEENIQDTCASCSTITC